MSAEMHAVMLWIAVAWPALLALPMLHVRLPWSRHLALVPALGLTLLPEGASVELSWLHFGTGLALDDQGRWMLAMSVAIWFIAASAGRILPRDPAYARATSFFLLTLTGHLGAILAADLVGFFSFSTLMGYAFYGLLLSGGNDQARHAGGRYVIFLIIADLALFEALLLAAFVTDNLRFSTVREAMAVAPTALLYLCLGLAGFLLKAGIWPFHYWLLAGLRSAAPSTALLLAGVPVVMGLHGVVRWLPLGQYRASSLGLALGVIGGAVILYALLRLCSRLPPKLLPAWVIIALTGAFVAALGMGLTDPDSWARHAYLVNPSLSALGVLLAVWVLFGCRARDVSAHPEISVRPVAEAGHWLDRKMGRLMSWIGIGWLRLGTAGRGAWQFPQQRYRRILAWRPPPVVAIGWTTAITLLTLFGLTLALLALLAA